MNINRKCIWTQLYVDIFFIHEILSICVVFGCSSKPRWKQRNFFFLPPLCWFSQISVSSSSSFLFPRSMNGWMDECISTLIALNSIRLFQFVFCLFFCDNFFHSLLNEIKLFSPLIINFTLPFRFYELNFFSFSTKSCCFYTQRRKWEN